MMNFTSDGQAWVANQLATSEPIENFVLTTVDPNNLPAGIPSGGQSFPVSQKGYLNPNTVVYSLMLGTDVGDFDFNFIGLVASGKLIAYAVTNTIKKRKTAGLVQGNNLTRNFALTFNDAANATGITVPAESWQVDFSAWFGSVDERERLSNFDLYGEQTFIGDGFKIFSVAGDLKATAGLGYVFGLRAFSDSNLGLNSNAADANVYIDVSLKKGIFNALVDVSFIVDSDEKTNYIDSAGTQHYVQKIASISAGAITDLRKFVNAEPPIILSLVSKSRPMLDGAPIVDENASEIYTITNYGFDVDYTVNAIDGAVSINKDKVTFTADAFSVGEYQKFEIVADGWTHEYTVQIRGLNPADIPASITYPFSNDTSSLAISWASVSNATSYTLQRQKDNGSWTTIVSSTTSTSFNDTVTDGSYLYRVRANNSDGSDGWRTGSSCVVDIPYPPAQPASITYPSNSANGAFNVSWATVPNATSYTLQRQKDGGAWTDVAVNTTATSRSESVTDGSYVYRVKANNADGSSSYRTGSACVVNILQPPAQPASISYPTTNDTGTFSVSWATVPNATSYTLEQQKDAGSWTVVVANTTSISRNVTVSDGDYNYRVKANNADGSSSYRTGHKITVDTVAPLVVTPSQGLPIGATQGGGSTSFSKSVMQLSVQGGSGNLTVTYENDNTTADGDPVSEHGQMYSTSNPASPSSAVSTINYTSANGTADGNGGLLFKSWLGIWSPTTGYTLPGGGQPLLLTGRINWTVTDNVTGETASGEFAISVSISEYQNL